MNNNWENIDYKWNRNRENEESRRVGNYFGHDSQRASSKHWVEHDQTNFTGLGPKGYKRMDDWIYEDACEALFNHPKVDATRIEVSVDDGCVHLIGEVDSRHEKRLAEACVERIFGVLDVQNRLKIANK